MHELQARTCRLSGSYREERRPGQVRNDWMKRELIEERAGDVFSEYTLGPHFIDFLPRAARALHRQAEGIQAALDRRRLLERR